MSDKKTPKPATNDGKKGLGGGGKDDKSGKGEKKK